MNMKNQFSNTQKNGLPKSTSIRCWPLFTLLMLGVVCFSLMQEFGASVLAAPMPASSVAHSGAVNPAVGNKSIPFQLQPNGGGESESEETVEGEENFPLILDQIVDASLNNDELSHGTASISPATRQWIKRAFKTGVFTTFQVVKATVEKRDQKEIVRIVWTKFINTAANIPEEVVAEIVDALPAQAIDALAECADKLLNKKNAEFDALSPTAWKQQTIDAVLNDGAAKAALASGDKKEIVRVVLPKLFKALAEIPPEVIADELLKKNGGVGNNNNPLLLSSSLNAPASKYIKQFLMM